MKTRDAFEQAMLELGYSNFRKEGGAYCLQELNQMKRAYIAGWRNGFMAESSLAEQARREAAA